MVMKTSSSILLGVIMAAGFAMPASAQESYLADLTGSAEVPGPGDRNGAGIATLDWNFLNDQLCYALAVDYIDPATAAHIHRAWRARRDHRLRRLTRLDAMAERMDAWRSARSYAPSCAKIPPASM
jgi:hypothetical protein